MTKAFDFESNFVSIDGQEAGAEFELMNDAGEPSGFHIRIAGPESKRREATQNRISDLILAGTGGDDTEKGSGQFARMRDLQLDDLVAATMDWRFPDGFEGPECTPENVREVYTKHSTIRLQALQAAADLSRFMKR